jgi:hypothetical protein
VNMCIVLATTKKNQLSVSIYYVKMCHYADELAAFDTALCNDELVAYLLAKLDEDYNSVFTTIVARTNMNTPSELYAQLLSFEQHTTLQGHSMSGGPSSAMFASRGRRYNGGRNPDRGQGRGRGRGRSTHCGFSNQSSKNSADSTKNSHL